MADAVAQALAQRVPPEFYTKWSTGPAMPFSLGSTMAASDRQGRAYFIGGRDNATGPVATNYRWNFSTRTWETLAPMPTARYTGAMASDAQGRVYVIGGRNTAGTALGTVERFDPATGAWTTLASITPRFELAATTDPQGRIYAIGGYSTAQNSDVQRFDPATGVWTYLTSLPQGICRLAAASDNSGRIYVMGGSNAANGATITTTYRFDPAAGNGSSWATLGPLNTSRSNHSAFTDPAGRIYAAAGNGADYFTSIERLDPATATWTTLADKLPAAMQQFGTAGDGAGRFVMAVAGATYVYDTRAESLFSTGAWATAAAVSAVRYGGAVTSDGTRVYVTHGYVSGSATVGGSTITPAGAVNALTPAAIACAYPGAAWCNGQHFVLGGMLNGGMVQNIQSYAPAGAGGAAGTWTAWKPWGYAVQGLAAAAVGNTVYLAGGTSLTTVSATNNASTLFRSLNTTQVPANATYDPVGIGAALPAGRAFATMVAVGTRLYLIGGLDTTNAWQSTVYVYDTTNASAAWTIGPATPVALTQPVAAVIGTAVYVVGTGTAVYRLDTTTGTWTTVAGLAAPHGAAPGLAAVGSTLVLVSGASTTSVDVLDLTTMGTSVYSRRVRALGQYLAGTDAIAYAATRQLPANPLGTGVGTGVAYPLAVSGLAVVSDSAGRVWGAGGTTNNTAVASTGAVYRLDPGATAWVAGPALLTAPWHPAAGAAPDGTLFVVGGLNTSGNYSAAGQYLASGATAWTSTPSLPTALAYSAGVCDSQGRFYVIGGTSSGNASALVYRYTRGAASWETLSSPTVPRMFASATLDAAGRIILAGGSTTTAATSAVANVERFDPKLGTWTTLPSLPSARSRHAGVRDSQGRTLLAGGWDSGANGLGSLVRLDAAGTAWTALATPLTLGRANVHGGGVQADGTVVLPGGDTNTLGSTTTAVASTTATVLNAGLEPDPAAYTLRARAVRALVGAR